MVDFASNGSEVEKPYIVLGFHEPVSKLGDGFLHCTDEEYHSAMAEEFGNHYLNLNGEIRKRSDELMEMSGITATDEDISYLNNGNIPRSFYSQDLFHPCAIGYKVIATLIHDKMVKLGYLQDSYLLTTGEQL